MAAKLVKNRAGRAELTFWACFSVIFALVSQALFPPQVMAATNRGETRIFLCTDAPGASPVVDHAAETLISSHDKSKRYQGLKCASCVLASITSLPVPDRSPVPAVFSVHIIDLATDPASQPVQARAPPRPFSCGPPAKA